MKKEWIILFFVCVLVTLFINANATAFEINGTVYDSNSTALNGANISVVLKDQTWTSLGTNTTLSNSTGWFNLTLPDNATYSYQLSITHNDSTGVVNYVGQSLPAFPYSEFSLLSSVNYYLKEAGTINITVINSSGNATNFDHQVKDVKLGYSIGGCTQNQQQTETICYVPRDRNYSIMVFPARQPQTQFVPVSYSWDNFTATQDYNIDSLSSYNATTKTLQKQFNITEGYGRISGYINGSLVDIAGWDELTVVPFVSEPGSMVFMTYGKLPFNGSVISGGLYATDAYNLTTGTYNITLPYAASETVQYILFAAAKNGSTYYGGYRNVTVTGNATIDFTMYGMLGSDSIINQSSFNGGYRIVNTSRQEFRLVNGTTGSNNESLDNSNAHIETTVDYTNYGAIEFTFMEDLSGANYGNFSLPLINVTGFKEMNVYDMNKAPKRVPTRTVAQINANNNISMTPFNPQALDGTTGASISIALYRSNSTCDVPNPIVGCNLTSTSNMNAFNLLPVVIGGGKISFRMGMGDVLVHYVDVDMLASGPPDASFEDNNDITEGTTDGFSKAMRFGSNGPTIYDYVLISIPYTEGSSSATGLSESAEVNVSIPVFYDESWNIIWNTSLNGTNAALLAGNDSHYSLYQSEWGTLMGNNTCIATTTGTSEINSSYPCVIDTTLNRIWLRLPHFSGTGTDVDGTVIFASSDDGEDSTGGGGGVGGGTPANKTHKKTQYWSKITPGSVAIMKITNPEIGFKQINITVINPAQKVTISVTKLAGQPASVVHVIEGKVYKYIEITTQNINDTHIKRAKIQFEVNKTWINDNNIDPDTIALHRYTNRWEKLYTRRTGEDNGFVYYDAETLGFSVFAISGEVKPGVTITTVPGATTTPTGVTTVPVTEAVVGFSPWHIVIIIVIIVGVIGLWMYKRRLIIKKR